MASVRDDMDMNPMMMMDNPVFSTGSSVNLFCPLCHEMFVNPRLLPCLHTFCKRCLENLVVPRSSALSCPACRTDVPLTVCTSDQLCFNFMHDFLNFASFENNISFQWSFILRKNACMAKFVGNVISLSWPDKNSTEVFFRIPPSLYSLYATYSFPLLTKREPHLSITSDEASVKLQWLVLFRPEIFSSRLF